MNIKCQSLRAVGGRNQRGVSMIEVLIAFFVLSIGLMGLAALQVKAVQYNQGAYQRSQATLAANPMLDMIRANASLSSPAASPLLSYNMDFATSATQTSTVIEQDKKMWKEFLAATLPDGKGAVACNNGTRICTISVQWADRFSSEPTELFTVTSQL